MNSNDRCDHENEEKEYPSMEMERKPESHSSTNDEEEEEEPDVWISSNLNKQNKYETNFSLMSSRPLCAKRVLPPPITPPTPPPLFFDNRVSLIRTFVEV
ncbi:hypothetical protein DICVIV_02482 [Dictyocaulus viviparus]|uniref:Uncharacterized protein n=1 Tax=Dictyocaulus viviparus TaxID=29172 RepID=A0A0D8Y3C3_DICVI|nr:hypothetical protein DICVIV_02482 [Dictyocaulus viviparus]